MFLQSLLDALKAIGISVIVMLKIYATYLLIREAWRWYRRVK